MKAIHGTGQKAQAHAKVSSEQDEMTQGVGKQTVYAHKVMGSKTKLD